MTDAFVPSPADVVWNRASADLGEGVGDRHLRVLLLVHGMMCNGGPNHVADSYGAEIPAAAEACRYFGLDALAALMLQLPAAASGYEDEDVEARLSGAYYELVPDDATISDAFEARYAEAPEDFDPITEANVPPVRLD
ncbi:DMP19 family protein [Actinoplanes xinjiangensis]|uniref:DMP19 family protein n=1 Tax=Actinoplanes xinjiangensis TaxID=512350 RepID=UPI00343F78E9